MKKAFTLAEVLITLGIIGVVAALTIPTLIQRYEERATVVKMKKMHSVLSQALLMNKALNEITIGQSATEIAQIFLPYLKVAKDCGVSERGCVYNGKYAYKSGGLQNKYEVGGGLSAYRVILSDGSCIWFRKTSISGDPLAIFYDINGANSPNTWGKDLFLFEVVNDVVVPAGGEHSHYAFDTGCSRAADNGYACAAWIVRYGNMDYLHCEGLKLNGPKTSCN